MSTLWAIKGRLFELAELRRDTVELMSFTPQDEADKEVSLAAIDQQIREYITEEVSKNPDSIHQYILESRARQAALKIEQRRIDGLLAAEEGNEARAKQLTLEVMNILGVKALPVQGTLRRQGNGGVQPVEIVQPELVLDEYQRITVTLPLIAWNQVSAEAARAAHPKSIRCNAVEPDLTAIREQLQKRELCPECYGGSHGEKCPTCGGDGTIPCGVPGARLAPKGEHLRVS